MSANEALDRREGRRKVLGVLRRQVRSCCNNEPRSLAPNELSVLFTDLLVVADADPALYSGSVNPGFVVGALGEDLVMKDASESTVCQERLEEALPKIDVDEECRRWIRQLLRRRSPP